ncbi:TetR/AcrR family transcriptional regulator [Nocardioides jensenii]|uniref:TetR/AcrR family transcriptional regulator n=1 Tax=Nocardioides jensenii TaxID=1843 RepID=UPI0008333D3E|nr:TetR/AcrR family transcriptional regulator [Nocardioides jensenii]
MTVVTPPTELPLLGQPAPERRDAARNRDAVLNAALRLVKADGACAVTMEKVAEAAGVGKGTVFRRFESRAGLMGAVLDHSESAWQNAVISGPPPLGPGAPPLERLQAFGRSRLELNLRHADLIEAAISSYGRSYAAYSFAAMHVRHLLTELGVTGDLYLLTTAVLAPLEPEILRQHRSEGVAEERIVAGWDDLVRRILAG